MDLSRKKRFIFFSSDITGSTQRVNGHTGHSKITVSPFCRCRRPEQSLEAAALEYADALETEILNQGPETVLAFIMEPVGGAATGALVAPDIYYTPLLSFGTVVVEDDEDRVVALADSQQVFR